MSTAARDMARIDRLYASHWLWLRDWLSPQTRCRTRAEDLAQDTFCRLLERSPGEPLRDARSYLAKVARRLLIDDVRRGKVERAIMAAIAEEDLINAVTPERIVMATQMLTALMRVLDGLSQPARDTFILRRIEGLEQHEIAERLGISISSVRRYTAQAYVQCHAVASLD